MNGWAVFEKSKLTVFGVLAVVGSPFGASATRVVRAIDRRRANISKEKYRIKIRLKLVRNEN